MALVFMDGFDKYGPANSNGTSVVSLLTAGEWTTFTTASVVPGVIVSGLSGTGYAIQVNGAVGGGGILTKSLGTSYGRLIGGVRFSSTLGTVNTGVVFQDSSTIQSCITINATTGTISVRTGGLTGTAIGTSTASVSANTTHYLEWDISFGNAASYQVWLDGVSVLGPATGDTTSTANNTANVVALAAGSNTAGIITFDDLYVFDSTGTANNAVLLTSPRIETTFAVSDSALQFAVGAAILGSSAQRTTTNSTTTANNLSLRRFTPSVTGTLSSISIVSNATNAGAQFRPVIYADSAGTAGTLMSTGSSSTGITSGVVKTMALTTAQSLSAGTQYWIGFQSDTAVSFQLSDGDSAGYRAAATFASGAPSTAPTLVTGTASWLVWGNLTAVGTSTYAVNQQPPPGQYSYVYDATVGHEDLYNMGAMSTTPGVVHAVAMKAFVQKSDSGTKTVSLRIKSGSTDSGGSNTGQGMGTTFGWLASYFPTDPDTSAAWTAAALNAATAGFRVDS